MEAWIAAAVWGECAARSASMAAERLHGAELKLLLSPASYICFVPPSCFHISCPLLLPPGTPEPVYRIYISPHQKWAPSVRACWLPTGNSPDKRCPHGSSVTWKGHRLWDGLADQHQLSSGSIRRVSPQRDGGPHPCGTAICRLISRCCQLCGLMWQCDPPLWLHPLWS